MQSLITVAGASLSRVPDVRGSLLIAALSGGRDSVCLLAVLKDLSGPMGFGLEAVHVNHQLRKTAGRDQTFCEDLCQKWQVPLTVSRVDVKGLAEKEGLTIEEAARLLRYRALNDIRQDRLKEDPDRAVYIVLGHHQKDQAETVLLHLLRGSGLRGLCGMKEQSGPYLRPLLRVPPDQMDAFVKDRGLSYVTDETNFDTAMTRNRIRLDLIPYLQKEFNPSIVETLYDTALRLREDEEVLDQIADAAFAACKVSGKNGDGLSVTQLNKQPEAIRRRVVRRWLSEAGHLQDLTFRHVGMVLDLCRSQSGKRVCLKGFLTVERAYDILILTFDNGSAGPKTEEPVPYQIEEIDMTAFRRQKIDPAGRKAASSEQWMDADKISDPLFRHRQPSDYMVIALGKDPSGRVLYGRKKLKEILIENKIPLCQRDRLWVLASGSYVAWAEKVRMSDDAKIGPGTKRVLHVKGPAAKGENEYA